MASLIAWGERLHHSFSQMLSNLECIEATCRSTEMSNFLGNVDNARFETETLLGALYKERRSQMVLTGGEVTDRQQVLKDLEHAQRAYEPLYRRLMRNVEFGVRAALMKEDMEERLESLEKQLRDEKERHAGTLGFYHDLKGEVDKLQEDQRTRALISMEVGPGQRKFDELKARAENWKTQLLKQHDDLKKAQDSFVKADERRRYYRKGCELEKKLKESAEAKYTTLQQNFSHITTSMNAVVAGWGGSPAPTSALALAVAATSSVRSQAQNIVDTPSQRSSTISSSIKNVNPAVQGSGTLDTSQPSTSFGSRAMNPNRSIQNTPNTAPAATSNTASNPNQIPQRSTSQQTQRPSISTAPTLATYNCNFQNHLIQDGYHLVRCHQRRGKVTDYDDSMTSYSITSSTTTAATLPHFAQSN